MMKEIAKRYLDYLRHQYDPKVYIGDCFPAPINELHRFVYNGGIWDGAFRTNYPVVKDKPIIALTLQEVYTHLTYIICTERCNEGFIEHNMRNGVLEALLQRYLELTKEDAE